MNKHQNGEEMKLVAISDNTYLKLVVKQFFTNTIHLFFEAYCLYTASFTSFSSLCINYANAPLNKTLKGLNKHSKMPIKNKQRFIFFITLFGSNSNLINLTFRKKGKNYENKTKR
jgi:hypothetical protein